MNTFSMDIEKSSDGIGRSKKRKYSNWKGAIWKPKLFKKLYAALKTVIKILILIYLFMCGVDLLTTSFKLIAGQNVNELTRRGTLKNPLVGLIVGVLITIMVQSSSTSTAIIVSLVSSKVISIEQAIPVIMGSNIGTSVTNTFVSFTQVQDRATFERAFAGATVHDMFNWLCVLVFLSIEVITKSIPGSRGLLEYTTEVIVNRTFSLNSTSNAEPSGLKDLISPIIKKIIQIDGEILECWANDESKNVTTIIHRFCDKSANETTAKKTSAMGAPFSCPVKNPAGNVHCCFLFANSTLSDREIGLIILVCSLVLIIFCLVTLVRVLNSVLKGAVQETVKKYINSDLPYAPCFTGYFAIVVGAIMTMIMQSSSIFTSLLTPLIGMGIISIERCYPLTLGSNIGTTTTALLAAFTENSKNSIQIALVHLLFNIFGILLFFPIPVLRFPIPMCRFLGRITAKYRWFAIVYIISVFVIMPCFLLMLSNAGPIVFWTIIAIISFFVILIATINFLQEKFPTILPNFLQDWEFVPLPFRSLEPYDRIVTMCLPKRFLNKISATELDSGHEFTTLPESQDKVITNGFLAQKSDE